MKTTIIDYGAGNIQSILFALERLGYEATLSADASEIERSDKIIFPGVGEASTAMEKLKATGLHNLIPQLTQPVLGICLGMQLMCRYSEEGNTQGLNIFDVDVCKFSSILKVPQVGWNTVYDYKSELFQGISEKEYMYSVHSYYAPIVEETIACSQYGIPYSAALQKDNFYGVQFHPEKSSKMGARLLKNFLEL